MTWEEIIIHIRKDTAYKELVELAYFEEDLALNVERFRVSEEFLETCNSIREYDPVVKGRSLLDLGAGNGIASCAFAISGYKVTAVEPDSSNTIGNGAIRQLREKYALADLQVQNAFGEELPFKNGSFDIVYVRQAVHHAHDLQKFIGECSRVLKKGGLLVTVRDHVIYDEKDKALFLEAHLLHKFYGGENAFTYEEYTSAMLSAGFKIKKVLRHYDSVINYFPESKESVEGRKKERNELVYRNLHRKLPGFIASNPWVIRKYQERLNRSIGKALEEKNVPGRMISFFAVKK